MTGYGVFKPHAGAELRRLRAEIAEARRRRESGENCEKRAVGYCYYGRCRHSGDIKIGFTAASPGRRALDARTEFLAWETGGRLRETERHNQFADSRRPGNGERFAPTPELLGLITELRAANLGQRAA